MINKVVTQQRRFEDHTTVILKLKMKFILCTVMHSQKRIEAHYGCLILKFAQDEDSVTIKHSRRANIFHLLEKYIPESRTARLHLYFH